MYELLLQAGPVEDIYLPVDAGTSTPKGFGFATFEHAVSVGYAAQLLNGLIFFGRVIKVATSSGPGSRISTPRGAAQSSSHLTPHQDPTQTPSASAPGNARTPSSSTTGPPARRSVASATPFNSRHGTAGATDQRPRFAGTSPLPSQNASVSDGLRDRDRPSERRRAHRTPPPDPGPSPPHRPPPLDPYPRRVRQRVGASAYARGDRWTDDGHHSSPRGQKAAAPRYATGDVGVQHEATRATTWAADPQPPVGRESSRLPYAYGASGRESGASEYTATRDLHDRRTAHPATAVDRPHAHLERTPPQSTHASGLVQSTNNLARPPPGPPPPNAIRGQHSEFLGAGAATFGPGGGAAHNAPALYAPHAARDPGDGHGVQLAHSYDDREAAVREAELRFARRHAQVRVEPAAYAPAQAQAQRGYPQQTGTSYEFAPPLHTYGAREPAAYSPDSGHRGYARMAPSRADGPHARW